MPGETCACDTTDNTLRMIETNITAQQHLPITAILPGDTHNGGTVEFCLGPLVCTTGTQNNFITITHDVGIIQMNL